MDTIGDPDIKFNEEGVCNYYFEFKEKLKVRVPEPNVASAQLEKIISKIKEEGKKKKYDCIIGISGGVDSTYTAYYVKKMGLRPLAVHLDNGWNSELAVKNIENILNKLEIDLFTEVLDWEMFKELQISFLKGSTPDGEIPTDHAILAILYKVANKFGVKYIISGMNFRNEGMLPPSWGRGYLDWRYIRSVHAKYSKKSLKGYPHFGIIKFLYYNLFKKIRSISFINYIDFNKDEAMKLIQDELGWKYYGGKHYESIYTRFYQSYILPQKFGIDKRKAHLTCLIISTGEVTRDEAIDILKKPIAPPEIIEHDLAYLLKKMELTKEEFGQIMDSPIKSIMDYSNYHIIEIKFRKLLNKLRKLGIMPN
jgi:N-acetyl sugar amidotransferase